MEGDNQFVDEGGGQFTIPLEATVTPNGSEGRVDRYLKWSIDGLLPTTTAAYAPPLDGDTSAGSGHSCAVALTSTPPGLPESGNRPVVFTLLDRDGSTATTQQRTIELLSQ